MNNLLLLVARVLLAVVFLMTVWVGSPTAGYLGSLHLPAPALLSWIAMAAEAIIVVSLVFGFETRWGAALGVIYVIIATALAHRYWEYTDAAQVAQYNNFAKNLAIMGGLIMVYVAGAGDLSIDARRAKKPTAG